MRHVRAEDEAALLAFLGALSPTSRRLRFFSLANDLAEAAHRAAAADGFAQIGLLVRDASGTIIGHAACFRLNERDAEVAVEIDEAHRHRGLATALIAALARESEEQGVARFVAEVLPENREMLAVFHDGFAAQDTWAPGEIDVAFPTSAWRDLPVRLADVALRSGER